MWIQCRDQDGNKRAVNINAFSSIEIMRLGDMHEVVATYPLASDGKAITIFEHQDIELVKAAMDRIMSDIQNPSSALIVLEVRK